MNPEIKVLDHGYVRLVEAWGHGDAGAGVQEVYTGWNKTPDMECGIIEAARQSTQASFRGWDDDHKLLKFLQTSVPAHATPSEFAGMILEVRAPIFVVREWQRHRTHSVTDDEFSGDWAFNEMSARYAPLPDQNYVPTVERLLRNSKTNKQAGTVKGADDLDEAGARRFQEKIRLQYEHDEALYQTSLQSGVPKELARLILPVGRYTQMRVTAYLRNWLGFCTLRSHSAAQEEIRMYSEAVETILKELFSRTWAMFCERRSGA